MAVKIDFAWEVHFKLKKMDNRKWSQNPLPYKRKKKEEKRRKSVFSKM